MTELLKPYLIWLHLHPHWAGLAAFLISFAESIAVIGLLIPGTVVMTAIGALIGSSVLPFVSITLWSIGGAIAGDVLSFWLGYHYHQDVRKLWLFKRYPKLLKKGELFFQQHGGKGVLLGRFIGPMRPIIPLIAGMMSMRPGRFILFDAISGLLWAPVYMLPGILIGAASQELPPEMATKLLIFIVILLLILWCVSWLLKLIYQSLNTSAHRLLAHWWNWVKRHPRLHKIDQFLQDPRYPENHGQFGLSLVFLLLIILFAVLTWSVVSHGWLTAWNVPIYHLMRSVRSTLFDQIMVLITFLGEARVIMFMWLAVLGWLAVCRHWRAAIHWFLVGILCGVLVEGIKHVIHSPRPSGLLQSPEGWSFPSGHSTDSTIFFGFLAILLSYGRARVWRVLAAIIATVLTITIVISRLYLGAHWLTDVCGGILIGLATLCVLTISYRRKVKAPLAPLGILLVAVFSLFIAWSAYFQTHYLKALHDYTPYWPKYTINAQQWWKQANKQIPQYRYNRFGKPIQVINLQWASTLGDVEQHLRAQGWHKESRHSLVILLSGLLSKDKTKQVPVLTQLYEDRRPILIMTKYLDKQNTLLVLRLWDAHLKTDTGLPLWLGTIGYHHWWQNTFFKRKHPAAQLAENASLIPATQLFIQDLNSFTWKQVQYKQIPNNLKNWDGYVLFIKP